MNFSSDDLYHVISNIWETALGLPLDQTGAGASKSPARSTAATVDISGGWSGTIVLDCSDAVARRAAAVMFDIDEAAVTRSTMNDAVTELVNMIGGHVKSLACEGCKLSLPEIVESADASALLRHSDDMTGLCCSCPAGVVSITVLGTSLISN